jgi:hypothetical protein
VTIKPNDDIKTKGCFEPEVGLHKGFRHPIVPKALVEYFKNGVPVEQTIKNEQSIYEFCISQKSDAKFKMQLWAKEIVQLQKTNRFYVSNSGGTIVKVDAENNASRIIADANVQLANAVDESLPISQYDINYSWYIKQATEIIEQITPSQLSLFDF